MTNTILEIFTNKGDGFDVTLAGVLLLVADALFQLGTAPKAVQQHLAEECRHE